MSEEPIEKRELNPFETALASLAPAATTRGRDELMFLAGRLFAAQERAAEREPMAPRGSQFRIAWPLATAASLLVALGGVWWGVQKPPQIVREVVRATEPTVQEPMIDVGSKQGVDLVAPVRSARSHSTSTAWHNATGEARVYLRLRDQLVAGDFESLSSPDRTNELGHSSDSFSEIRNRILRSSRQTY